MLNQVILVGRLTNNLEIKELEGDKKVMNMTLTIPRSFKNANGEYETDSIDVVLFDNIASNTKEYCKKGDIVGIRGRIKTEIINDIKTQEIIAEKVTFLSSRKENKNE